MIKGINALVDAKRASSFNNAIKLVNENVQITHDRLITLENRTAMMAKAIIPVLKDFKQQINNTNDRLTIIVMYFCCTKCRHTRTIFKYCFPFLAISHIVRMSRRTDLFVEVTNVMKGNGIWAHFVSTGYFPSQIQLSRPIQKDDVQIETVCWIFKRIRINWSSINVTGISGTMITMPDMGYVSIFTDNDFTHITEDHFEIKLIARLLDQMYVVQPPMFLPRYDDAPPSAPQFP